MTISERLDRLWAYKAALNSIAKMIRKDDLR